MLPVGAKMRTAVAALVIFLSAILSSRVAAADEQICDVTADTALGLEEYPTTIMLHRRVLRSHPDNALAHYHLGFAYGMMGRVGEEINEYRAAVNLGLNKWDLFLNLGLAYLNQHEFAKATAAFENAVLFGPEHAETHFNLAIVYEREGRLGEALQEITASRYLAPEDLDADNMNGVICAEMGDLVCARDVWTRLVQIAPGYAPARANLTILTRSCQPAGQFERQLSLSSSRAAVTTSHAAGNQVFACSQPATDTHHSSRSKAGQPASRHEYTRGDCEAHSMARYADRKAGVSRHDRRHREEHCRGASS